MHTGDAVVRRLVGTVAVAGTLLIAFSVPAHAASSRIRCDLGDDLQAAVDAATAGDDMIVRGTCVGPFRLDVAITLRGEDESATLQGSGRGAVLTLASPGGAASTISVHDITVSGGATGIRVGESSSAEFDSVRIEGNMTGLSLEPFVDVSVRDSEIASNAGNGIENDHGRLTLTASTVRDNAGHGIQNREQAQAIIRGSRIEANGERGIANLNSSTTLEDSVVTANAGGGVHNDGRSYLSVDGSVLTGNVSPEAGSGVYLGAGLDDISGGVAIKDSRIERNTSRTNGGGIYIEGGISTITISRVIIIDNAAGTSGGGIYQEDGSVPVDGVTFMDNRPDDCHGCP